MSAAVPRAAMQLSQKSGISIIGQAKAALRKFESHPFGRYPQQLKSAPSDWTRVGTRFNRAAVMYVPGMALFFGWPFAAEWMCRYT